MIDSIIFDLDGTLWDTRKETIEAVNKIADKYNIEEVSEETIENSMGLTDEEVAQKYMPNESEEKRISIFKQMDRENSRYLRSHGGTLYPDVKETLETLNNNYKLFIVSNCGAGYIESFIDYYKFNNLFTDFIAASKENISKTEAMKRLIDTYNLKKPIYVGDTRGDFEYARAANIPFVHAKYGFCPELETEYKINTFSELISCLEGLNS